MALAFDILLAIVLLTLAWKLLSCEDLFQAVVAFVSFGFLMALAWVRLDAPDVALAEAAIGSAMTGALLLAALSEFKPSEKTEPDRGVIVTGLVCSIVACLLGYAVLNQPSSTIGLGDVVSARMTETGVSNQVTAVLLSFRGYDTLLEIGVLLMAVMTVLSIQNARPSFARHPSTSPVLASAVRTLLPVLILASGYLLWVGAHAPGGAFQAGSVLAGAMILATLADAHWLRRHSKMIWRLSLVVGLAVFVVVAATTLLMNGSLLEYRHEASKWLLLAIETAATISIGCTLTVLLIGQVDHRLEEDPQ